MHSKPSRAGLILVLNGIWSAMHLGADFQAAQPLVWQGQRAGRSPPVPRSSNNTDTRGEVQFTNITEINSMSHPHRKLPTQLLKIHSELQQSCQE